MLPLIIQRPVSVSSSAAHRPFDLTKFYSRGNDLHHIDLRLSYSRILKFIIWRAEIEHDKELAVLFLQNKPNPTSSSPSSLEFFSEVHRRREARDDAGRGDERGSSAANAAVAAAAISTVALHPSAYESSILHLFVCLVFRFFFFDEFWVLVFVSQIWRRLRRWSRAGRISRRRAGSCALCGLLSYCDENSDLRWWPLSFALPFQLDRRLIPGFCPISLRCHSPCLFFALDYSDLNLDGFLWF